GGVPAIHFGLPVFTDGRVSGVAFVPLNLEWLSTELASMSWPKDAVIRVTDTNKVVIAAYPRSSEIGQPLDALDRGSLRDGFVVATSPIKGSDGRLSVWM